MPQFDVSSFFNQVFWLGFFFSCVYFLLVGFLLPDLVSGIKARYKKERGELALLFNEVLSYNRTNLALSIGHKLSAVKSSTKFNSAV